MEVAAAEVALMMTMMQMVNSVAVSDVDDLPG
jgi:hypothetical protein